MKLSDWWLIVDDNWVALATLINKWHPASKSFRQYDKDDPVITARAAEIACQGIRKEIQDKADPFWTPVLEALQAKDDKDYIRLSELLSSTWFGLPESESVHKMAGFRVLCSLLDDPPDEENYENENEF